MNGKMKSLENGILMGLFGHQLPKKKEPVAYLYGGIEFRNLPLQYDEKAYPYAALFCDSQSIDMGYTCFVVSDHPMYELFIEGGKAPDYHALVCKEPFNYINFHAVTSIIDGIPPQIAEWEIINQGLQENTDYYTGMYYEAGRLGFIGGNGKLLWANHDICNVETNELYLEKSEPVPFYAGWHTVFDGELTTIVETAFENGGQHGATSGYITTENPIFLQNELVKITVDGNAYDVIATVLLGYQFAGNAWLYSNALIESSFTDDGTDFLAIAGNNLFEFYTRNPGTYTVKIERYVPQKE